MRVPPARAGSFSSEFCARDHRSEQALILALRELVVNGVSTRKVAAIPEERCGREFAKSTVSDRCTGFAPLVAAWNERDLGGARFPVVVLDALVVTVREGGRVRARSALMATGGNEAGYREILGLQLGDSEAERSWGDCFTGLNGRGRCGVDRVVSDHHGGRVNAVRRQFQGATWCIWPRGQMHLAATRADATPTALHDEGPARVRALVAAPDAATARLLLARFVADYQQTAPAAGAPLERGFDDATAILALPAASRTRRRTTNGGERLNDEIPRRERVIGSFPNRESVVRLLGALLMEHDEPWSTGQRDFAIAADWQWRATHDTQEGGPTRTAQR